MSLRRLSEGHGSSSLQLLWALHLHEQHPGVLQLRWVSTRVLHGRALGPCSCNDLWAMASQLSVPKGKA